jgi:hypothetical protein
MTIPNEHLVFKKINPFSHKEETQKIWLDLQQRSQHSFFNSWGWISVWLNNLPENMIVFLHVGYIKDNPVCAFFLGEKRGKGFPFLSTRSFSLNATANPYYDNLYIEYNSVLHDSSKGNYFGEILEYMLSLDWHELHFNGISHQLATDFKLFDEKSKSAFSLIRKEDTVSFFVDLQKIAGGEKDFLQLLSSNRRSQLRRSLKQYETNGKIQVDVAKSTEEAIEFLEKLAHLHQIEWTKRGRPGSFSNQYFNQFHKQLIENQFDKGEIQLLHIYTDQMEIGYLYFFVYDSQVLFYQSGLHYHENDNNYRPGLVSHYLAILHNLSKGMKSYDFLAGDSNYKQTLSTDSVPMYWMIVYKNGWRYWLAQSVSKIKKTVKSTSYLQSVLRKIKIKLND